MEIATSFNHASIITNHPHFDCCYNACKPLSNFSHRSAPSLSLNFDHMQPKVEKIRSVVAKLIGR